MKGYHLFVIIAVLILAAGIQACTHHPGYYSEESSGVPQHYGPDMGQDYGDVGSMTGRTGNEMWDGRYMGQPGYGMGPGYSTWEKMTPAQQELYRRHWNEFNDDTRELRQKLAVKQIELRDLWEKPDADFERLKTLTLEIEALQNILERKRNEYLLECRKQFGNQGWSCPVFGRGVPGYRPTW